MHQVGFEMPRLHNAVPLLDVDGVVKALTEPLQSTLRQVLAGCIVFMQPPLKGLFHAYAYVHMSSGLSLIAHAEGIVSFLCLGLPGACSGFCSLGWAVMACRLLLAGWLSNSNI